MQNDLLNLAQFKQKQFRVFYPLIKPSTSNFEDIDKTQQV